MHEPLEIPNTSGNCRHPNVKEPLHVPCMKWRARRDWRTFDIDLSGPIEKADPDQSLLHSSIGDVPPAEFGST